MSLCWKAGIYKSSVASLSSSSSTGQDSAARNQLDIDTVVRNTRLFIDNTMEKKNPGVAFAPGTDSTAGLKHEAQPGFKESTVPAVRFWILSIG